MAAIKKGYARGTDNTDALPSLDTVLRDIATDLAALGAAVGGVDVGESTPAALNSVQEATTNAVDLGTSEALANSLKLKYNTLQADVVALRASLATVIAALGTSGAAVTILTTAP
jgi:hypothetical protein